MNRINKPVCILSCLTFSCGLANLLSQYKHVYGKDLSCLLTDTYKNIFLYIIINKVTLELPSPGAKAGSTMERRKALSTSERNIDQVVMTFGMSDGKRRRVEWIDGAHGHTNQSLTCRNRQAIVCQTTYACL